MPEKELSSKGHLALVRFLVVPAAMRELELSKSRTPRNQQVSLHRLESERWGVPG